MTEAILVESSWLAAYQSDLQTIYSLLVVPLAFLAYRAVVRTNERRAVVPAATAFVSSFTILFALETMLDPISTGPILKSALFKDSFATSIIPFVFVYLGDFRVLLLLAAVARPAEGVATAIRRSSLIALIIPVLAGTLYAAAQFIWPETGQKVLWMLYESGFLILAVILGRKWVPQVSGGDDEKAEFLRAVLGYSAAYYTLWLSADFVIVLGGLDEGWALRMIPNQLYYALWIPFVYFRFFSRGRGEPER